MKRRGFIAGLLALPFVAPIAKVAISVKRKLWPTIVVGKGESHATIASAMKDIEPGGVIFLKPEHHETIGTVEIPDGVWIRGTRS